jgi:hypothetical protein
MLGAHEYPVPWYPRRTRGTEVPAPGGTVVHGPQDGPGTGYHSPLPAKQPEHHRRIVIPMSSRTQVRFSMALT